MTRAVIVAIVTATIALATFAYNIWDKRRSRLKKLTWATGRNASIVRDGLPLDLLRQAGALGNTSVLESRGLSSSTSSTPAMWS
jgi:hypothetical protein